MFRRSCRFGLLGTDSRSAHYQSRQEQNRIDSSQCMHMQNLTAVSQKGKSKNRQSITIQTGMRLRDEMKRPGIEIPGQLNSARSGRLRTAEAFAAIEALVAGAVTDRDVAATRTGRRILLEMRH